MLSTRVDHCMGLCMFLLSFTRGVDGNKANCLTSLPVDAIIRSASMMGAQQSGALNN